MLLTANNSPFQDFTFTFSFSWELKWPQEKLKTMLIQILGWQTKSIMVCYGIFWSGQYYCGLLWVLFIKNDVWIFVGFTLEAKSVSSKLLIQVHLKILSRPVENMASHLWTKYITWSKSCESLGSLESWKPCTYTATIPDGRPLGTFENQDGRH